MSWIRHKEHYEEIAHSVTPTVTLMEKTGLFWTIVAWTISIISLGFRKPKDVLNDSAMAFGTVQAFPSSWGIIAPEEIVHEARHTWQMEKCGWAIPVLGWFFGARVRAWVGLPIFLFLSLVPFFVLVNYGRFRIELDAESLAWKRALHAGWLTPKEVRNRAKYFAEAMFRIEYFFAWPWAKKRSLALAEKIIKEQMH